MAQIPSDPSSEGEVEELRNYTTPRRRTCRQGNANSMEFRGNRRLPTSSRKRIGDRAWISRVGATRGTPLRVLRNPYRFGSEGSVRGRLRAEAEAAAGLGGGDGGGGREARQKDDHLELHGCFCVLLAEAEE